MNKVAVFGKPGGGKSTLSKKLSVETGIKLCALDLIEFKKDGERISKDEYSKKHAEWIDTDNWIIDGLGTVESFWLRIDAADILIYVDLPYYIHYWWVTKRLLKSYFIKPEGWPEGCSVWKGTLSSWRVLRLCPKFWTPELFEKINSHAEQKKIYRITSIKDLNEFVTKYQL